MTIKEAWELYNQVDNKLKEIRDLAHQIRVRYRDGLFDPLGCFLVYPSEMEHIMKLLSEYDKIIEERKNILIEGSVENNA